MIHCSSEQPQLFHPLSPKEKWGEMLWVNLNGRMHYGRLLELRQSSQEVFLWASIRLHLLPLCFACVVVIVAMFTASPGLFWYVTWMRCHGWVLPVFATAELNNSSAVIVIRFELEGLVLATSDQIFLLITKHRACGSLSALPHWDVFETLDFQLSLTC